MARDKRDPPGSPAPAAPPAKSGEPANVSPRRLERLLAFLAASFVPVLVDPGAVKRVADLQPGALLLEHAGLMYLWMPAVVASGSLLLLAPGLLAALALGAGQSVPRWVVSSVASSLVLVGTAATLVQAALGRPLVSGAFAAVVVSCAAAAGIFLALRLRRGAQLAWPFQPPGSRATAFSILAVPALYLVLQVPKLFWEDFNGDGVHTYEAARRLLVSPFPFLSSSEALAGYPGVRTALLSYPQAFYLRLFGECEASVRLPYLVFLGALYAALLWAIEHGRKEPVPAGERSLLWAALTIYAVVMAYSATYNPYHADIALPAAQDTLLLALVLGFAVAHAAGAPGWACVFLALAYTCSPAGILLSALWLAAALCVGLVPWRGAILPVVTLAGCFALETMAPAVLSPAGLGVPGSEHGLSALVSRLSKLEVPPWRRLAFLVLPSGIVPAAGLALWRRQDRMARACTLVTLVSFAFFAVQRKNALHYYAPAMVLPLVTLFRLDLWSRPRLRRPALAVVAAGTLVALGLSLPRDLSVYRDARLVGGAIVDRVAPGDPFDLSGYKRAEILWEVIPRESARTVPWSSFGEAAIVLYHYRSRDPRSQEASYVIQLAGAPPPPAMESLAEKDGVALFVRDRSVLARHLALRPSLRRGSRWYVLPKSALFAR